MHKINWWDIAQEDCLNFLAQSQLNQYTDTEQALALIHYVASRGLNLTEETLNTLIEESAK